MLTWRKLESEFKELGKQMIYTRLDVQWGAGGEFWHLAGNFDKNTNKRFTALSSIAGQKLTSVLNPSVEAENELLREPNHAIRWYKGIWKISQNFEFGFVGEQTNDDGTSAGHIYTGTIDKIADAAATFCLELAARYPVPEEELKTQAPPSELPDSNLSRGSQSINSDLTRVDKYLQKAKNHPYISLLILFGIIVISLAKFTDAINKLIDPFPFLHNKTAMESNTESSQTNTNRAGNAININRSNNITINQTQNVKVANISSATDTSASTALKWMQQVKRFENAKPRLQRPFDQQLFNEYPRNITLEWDSIPNAAYYEVEVQWLLLPEKSSWHMLPKYPIITKETTHSFQFVGAQPGRWRVVAVNAEGIRSSYSEWRQFVCQK